MRRPGDFGQICISERTGFTWGILFQRQTKFMKPPGVIPLLKWSYSRIRIGRVGKVDITCLGGFCPMLSNKLLELFYIS